MMRRRALTVAACLGCTLLVGCHRGNTYGCEDTRRYAGAASAAPVQIPDDLSPPSETDALRLPPVVANSRSPTRPCLEDPPAFSEQIRLGRQAEAASESDAKAPHEPSRRERRQQRRQADESK